MNRRWRIGVGVFGVLIGIVVVWFGIPLPLFLGVLVAMAAVTIRRKDLHLLSLGFFCSLGLPVLLVVAVSTAHYLTGPVHLSSDCRSIDRPEEVCFDEEYRAYRTNRISMDRRLDGWSKQALNAIESSTKKTLIDLFGPSQDSYQGPYISRHKAQDLLSEQGQKLTPANVEERPDDDSVRQLLRKHCGFVFRFPFRAAQHRFARSQIGDSEFNRPCFQRALEDPEHHLVYIHEMEDRLLLVGTSDPVLSVTEENPYPIDTVVLVDREDGRVIDYFLYQYDYC